MSLWTDITDWIRKQVNSMISAIAAAVHQIHVWEIELRFHLGQAIQKFYNTTAGFWTIIIGSAALIVVLPYVIKWAASQLAKIQFFVKLKALEAQVAGWKGWVYINYIIEANRAAQILFKSWGDIWKGIYQDVEGIANDIGLGLGALAAVTTSVRALLVTMNTTMGASEIAAEISSLGEMSTWLQGLSKNFDRYAEDPQNIWNDLWSQVILPKQNEVHNYFANTLGVIDAMNKEIKNLEKLPGEFKKYQADLEKTLNIKLSNAQKAAENKVFNDVNELIQGYNKNIGDKIDAIEKSVGPLFDAVSKHDASLAENSSKIANLENPNLNLPVSFSPTDIINLLGDKVGTFINTINSDAFQNNENIYLEIIGKSLDVAVGNISEEQLTEYVNSTGAFESPIVNPFAV